MRVLVALEREDALGSVSEAGRGGGKGVVAYLGASMLAGSGVYAWG